MKKRVVSIGHLGPYFVAARPMMELFGDEVLMAPQITKRTLELGIKHSPEAVCIPFKYSLGNFLEALEKGANVLVQIGGGCRMGYYGEVQKEILKKLGYSFEFIKLVNSHNIISVARDIHGQKPDVTYPMIAGAFLRAYMKVRAIDVIEKYIRLNIGFEVKKGSFEGLYRMFLRDLDRVQSFGEIRAVKNKYFDKLRRIQTDKPVNPIRVGIVGEVYVVMEPFSNFFIEKELARYGVEVHRFVNISGVIRHSFTYNRHIDHLVKEAYPYLTGPVGAHGTESVAKAHTLAKEGFDGLIHVKPFGCMPEVNAMSALFKLSKDHAFPIMYFSFDSLTSETGIKTRLEAFYDMLVMKKEKRYAT